MRSYDFVCVGGGSAGFNAARTAVSLGLKSAIIDGAKELGGLCILRGCMPSKTLLYMSDVLHLAQRAKTFGLKVPFARADLAAMQARKKKIIREFADYRLQALQTGRFDLIRDHARFCAAEGIAVTGFSPLGSSSCVFVLGRCFSFAMAVSCLSRFRIFLHSCYCQ